MLWQRNESASARPCSDSSFNRESAILGRQRDRDRLDQWQSELRDRALALFRDGQLEQAIDALAPLDQGKGPAAAPSGHAAGNMEPQPSGYERLEQLVEQERWWEALDSLNRLDHPGGRSTQAQRRLVESAIERLRGTEQHQQHGESDPA